MRLVSRLSHRAPAHQPQASLIQLLSQPPEPRPPAAAVRLLGSCHPLASRVLRPGFARYRDTVPRTKTCPSSPACACAKTWRVWLSSFAARVGRLPASRAACTTAAVSFIGNLFVQSTILFPAVRSSSSDGVRLLMCSRFFQFFVHLLSLLLPPLPLPFSACTLNFLSSKHTLILTSGHSSKNALTEFALWQCCCASLHWRCCAALKTALLWCAKHPHSIRSCKTNILRYILELHTAIS